MDLPYFQTQDLQSSRLPGDRIPATRKATRAALRRRGMDERETKRHQELVELVVINFWSYFGPNRFFARKREIETAKDWLSNVEHVSPSCAIRFQTMLTQNDHVVASSQNNEMCPPTLLKSTLDQAATASANFRPAGWQRWKLKHAAKHVACWIQSRMYRSLSLSKACITSTMHSKVEIPTAPHHSTSACRLENASFPQGPLLAGVPIGQEEHQRQDLAVHGARCLLRHF